MTYSTMTVEQNEEHQIIRMNWEANIQTNNIEQAYHDVMDVVNESDKAVFVVLDLNNNPNIPISELLKGALAGSYTDPKVLKWLLIGKRDASRSIANTLFFVTGENKVVWFEDETGASDYLDKLGWTMKH